MATVSKWTPFGVALNITATSGTVTRISATQFTVVINASWKTYWSGAETNYAMVVSSGTPVKSITLNKDGNKSGGSSGSFTGTYSISGNGAATKSITVTFTNSSDYANDSATKNITLSVSVPAWTSYTVKYNANGGSGAPGNQTKWKDQTLKLSTTKPTRTGYSFQGWATSASGSVAYAAGANYTANAAVTLYAVWKANTYTVTYNANGGTNPPGNQTKTYGVALTLTTAKPTRSGYNFLGWGTSASATTVSYKSGASYTANANITLYAIWQLAYKVPRITNYSAKRCRDDNTIADDGENALVQFTWACDKEVASIVIEIISSEDTSTYDVEASGTSGTVSMNVGGGELSTDSSYTINMVVTDSGGSYTRSVTIASNIYPIDFLAGGNGVAFGKSAEKEGYADFAYKILLKNNGCIYGTAPNGDVVEALNSQNANGNTVLGYDNYDQQRGNTNIYGYDVNIGVSNVDTPGYFRPYRRKGDTINITLRTAGYVTNAGKQVSFWIPFAIPIIGSPTVTLASVNGFILRQGNGYTHGSTASVYAIPDSYTVSRTAYNGIYAEAQFSTTTNVTNNDAIGVYWSGTITFS